MSIINNNLLPSYYGSVNPEMPSNGLLFYASYINSANADTGQSIVDLPTNAGFGRYQGVHRIFVPSGGYKTFYYNFSYTAKTPFTFSVYVNCPSSSSYNTTISYNSHYLVTIATDGTINIRLHTNTIYTVPSSESNKWKSIIITYNGSTGYGYLNGVYVGSVTYGVPAITSLRVTKNGNSLRNGISSMRFYNRVLTNSEIITLANEFHPGT